MTDENRKDWACEVCKEPGHYTHTDGLGYWRTACDEHDKRELFQENRKLRAELEKALQDKASNDADYVKLSVELYRLKSGGKCPPHSWNDDGERCTKCGDKDWMT